MLLEILSGRVSIQATGWMNGNPAYLESELHLAPLLNRNGEVALCYQSDLSRLDDWMMMVALFGLDTRVGEH